MDQGLGKLFTRQQNQCRIQSPSASVAGTLELESGSEENTQHPEKGKVALRTHVMIGDRDRREGRMHARPRVNKNL